MNDRNLWQMAKVRCQLSPIVFAAVRLSKIERFCRIHLPKSPTRARWRNLLRGEIVIVRTFGGKPVECRVWDVGDTLVYVTNDEEFEKLIAGKAALAPIGFPKEDIFCRPASNFHGKRLHWSQLIPWRS
jgi:hypothetical protein